MIRLLTASGLIAFALYLVFFAPQPIFLGGALLMGLLCYLEFGNLVAAHAIVRPGPIGVALGAALVVNPSLTFIASTLTVLLQLVISLRNRNLREIAPESACVVFGGFYAFMPWRYAVDLRAVSPQILFFALALNWIGDSSAFYIGRAFGRHKLAPIVSPGKSWEGAIASVAGSALFGVVYLHYFLPSASPLIHIFLSVAGNVAGQVGDLAESAIKRGAGLKDSGTLLPGHGGILDRVDSSLFSLPVIALLGQQFNLF